MGNSLPYPTNKLIADLMAGLLTIDPNWLMGIYITGSIPLGDFHLNKSDIDFLVLVSEFPTNERITQLEELHHKIQSAYRQPLLNGTYITTENLRMGNLSTHQVLHFHEGRLRRGPFDMGPIALYELTTTAYTLMGESANQLPIDIQIEQVKEFMYDNINSYWRSWITKHASLTNRQVLLILAPILTEWAVLGVARLLYTLQTGKIGSKREAGEYCIDKVPSPYQAIIRQAIQIRNDSRGWVYPVYKNVQAVAPSLKRATQTVNCVHYLIDLFNQVYEEQKHQRNEESPRV